MKDCDEGGDIYECSIWVAAEGVTSGKIYLTKDQYKAIKYASDFNNWRDVDSEGWNGSFGISCKYFD